MAQAGQIRPVVVALASSCARYPCADVAEHTTPANRHGRRQDLEKCEEVPHALTLFQVSLSASITRGSSVFHKSLKRGQRAPVAFPVVSHLLPLHQLSGSGVRGPRPRRDTAHRVSRDSPTVPHQRHRGRTTPMSSTVRGRSVDPRCTQRHARRVRRTTRAPAAADDNVNEINTSKSL